MYIRPLRKKLEKMKRPDPVPAVRRIGNPVNQVQNIGLGTNDGLPSCTVGFEHRTFFVNANLKILVNGLLHGAEAESIQELR